MPAKWLSWHPLHVNAFLSALKLKSKSRLQLACELQDPLKLWVAFTNVGIADHTPQKHELKFNFTRTFNAHESTDSRFMNAR